jgi:hypothetical protein
MALIVDPANTILPVGLAKISLEAVENSERVC